VHFVIAGGRGWLNEEVRTLVTALGLNDHIHFIGYVSQQELPALYSMAIICAYPSLYEGFGLPVIEAMQCGMPVLTANVSSLPEVAGDAAVCLSPTNIEEIADGLRFLLEDPAR
jgi:glycosyltransferase involved in cell wall biosynthesis